MANWRPVDVRLWNDRKFLAGGDDARLLWLFLLTCPSLPIPGVVVGGDAALAELLGWTTERLRERFHELLQNGLQVRRESRIVWLPNALKYQRPSNPNMVKCWAGKWDDVPEGALKPELWEAIRIACKRWSVLFGRLFLKPLPEPLPEPLGDGLGNGSRHKHQHKHEHKHQHDPEEKNLSLAGAHAIPPSTDPTPVPSTTPAQSFADRDLAKLRANGQLAEATWQRLSDLRMKHAEKLQLVGVFPFPVIHPGNHPRGFRELLDRIREEGERAHDTCDHVLRVLDEQAAREKDIEWLAEKAFMGGPWEKARNTPLKKRKPAVSARPSTPSEPRVFIGSAELAEIVAPIAPHLLGITKEPA